MVALFSGASVYGGTVLLCHCSGNGRMERYFIYSLHGIGRASMFA